MRKRLNDESGVAMIVAMAVLLAVALLAAALGATAQQTNSVTVRDSSSKRALAAAEAGLQIATRRFAETSPGPLQCLAGTGAQAINVAAGSECGAVSGGLGHGAAYSYVISLPGAPCKSVAAATVNDRCITSTGTVQGVQRRLQTRVGQTIAPSYFSFNGLVGLDSLRFVNSVKVDSDIGSNGTITIGNAEIDGNAILGLSTSTVSPRSRVRGSIIQPRPGGPWELPPNNEFDTVKLPENNNNGLLPISRYTASTGRFTAGTYQLPVVPSGTTTYYFCSVYIDGGHLTVPAGRRVRIFVDSPTRPLTGCPPPRANGGTVIFNDSTQLNQSSGSRPENLQFFLAGCQPGPCATTTNKCKSDYPGFPTDLGFCNSAGSEDKPLNALFHAPNSYALLANSAYVNGALGAKSVVVNNSANFSFPSDGIDEGEGEGETTETGWFECRPQPSVAGDPESGC